MKNWFNRLPFLISVCTILSTIITTPLVAVSAQSSMPDRPFIYLAQQNIGTIDPAKAVDETEIIAAVNMYEPLMFPERTEGSMTPVPYLATDYEVSEDGLTYTINLRDDVKFHSGNALTAKDIVYSMERMLAIGQGNSWLWEGLFADKGIIEEDENTVKFILNKPYAPFISSLLLLFIVDSETLIANEVDGDYGQEYIETASVGTGAYKLDTWNREEEINYVANDNYWQGWSDNQIKNINMKFISEQSTVKSLISAGQADMLNQYMNPSTYEDLKAVSGVVVPEDPSAMILEFPMNTQLAPTDDINVRKAIASVFDYSIATDQILLGAEQAQGPVPITVSGHSSDVTVYQKDLEKAKEYLEQSAYAGQDLTVTLMYLGDQAEQRQFSQLLTANLAEIGIKLEVIPVTWPQVTEAAASPETTANLTIISDSLKYPHADSHTYGKYHPSTHGSFRSMAWLDDEELTSILESARAATNDDEQIALYQEAQNKISELTPSVYVSNNLHRIAYRDYIEGYTYVPLMGFDLAFYYFTTK